MSWFKVDDLLCGHKKARRAGKAAMGLWTLSGSYAAQQLTNGFVPEHFVNSWNGRREATALVQAGLWETGVSDDGEKGWWFHDWPEYQPTREKVLAERVKAKERQRIWRERNGVTDGVTNGVTGAVTDAARNAYPDPTRPDPSSVGVLRSVSGGSANPNRHLGDGPEIGLG